MKRGETLVKDIKNMMHTIRSYERLNLYESTFNGKIMTFTLTEDQREKLDNAYKALDELKYLFED